MKLTLYQKDCFEAMKGLEANSIDAIITDPPYALTSTTKPRIDQSEDKEVPFSRQQSRIGGFMGMAWDSEIPKVEVWQECLRVLKNGAFAFIFMTPRQDSHLELLINLRQAGFNIGFTPIVWAYASGFPKASNISKMVDKRLGFKREGSTQLRAGSKGNTFPLDQEYETGKPISEPAKVLDGSYGGFQPKPAVEMIVVAMKPLSEKTYVDQALKNRHGITWLDDCRVPYASDKDIEGTEVGFKNKNVSLYEGGWDFQKFEPQKGRFPANLLVSDNVLDTGKIYKTGSGIKAINGSHGLFGIRDSRYENYEEDSGDFSRYFSLDAWTEQNLTQFVIEPKADKGERNENLYGFEEQVILGVNNNSYLGVESAGVWHTSTKNIHPSVKPISIMSYLIKLSTREGDTVLDPFLGSGTTMIAARNLRRNCIGMEREEQYVKIAKGRLQWNAMQKMGFVECVQIII